jgi:hypothetical protein
MATVDTERSEDADPHVKVALAESAALERPVGPPQAMYFYGVVRARAWRSGRGEDEDVARVRYRDIEALVRTVPFAIPPLDDEHVQAHQRAVERAMRRGTILPAPYGVVFRGRRQLIRLLQDQYLVFDEGLSFLDGHWELRLHITAGVTEFRAELRDVATQIYSGLRRFARAAVPFPREEHRLLSAAFLVERASWLEFMERVGQLGEANPEMSFDITGPWPPYDFVRIVG